MSKKLFTMFLLVLFVATVINAQEKSISKRLADDSFVPTTLAIDGKIYPNLSKATGESIGLTTDYDYFSNSIVRDQIVWDAAMGTPQLHNMIRPFPGAPPTSRRVVHSYKVGSAWVNNDVRGAAAGWPHVDLGLTGDLAGVMVGVYHAGCNLFLWDGATGYPATQFEANTDPSVQISGANIFTSCSGNRTEFEFYKTEDFGSSYTRWAVMSDFAGSITWIANGGVEVGMSKSPDEQYLVQFGTNLNETVTGNGAHVWDGVPVDSADCVWMLYSSDAGTNWTPSMIGHDGMFDLVDGYHTADYGPLFENFGQLDMAVANDGVVHAVANGYGLVFDATRDSAIASSFPVLYWNSTTETWVSISDPDIDDRWEAIEAGYPGNGFGQYYPSISASEDGQVLYAMWSGPEITAADTFNVDPAYGLYHTDLYHAYSVDGGANWTYGGLFPGMVADISETFGHAAQHLEKISDTEYRAHIVYMADPSVGVGVFGEGDIAALADILYTTYDIVLTSVDDDANLVRNFDLAQNYPNPFNPSTVINYTLAERSNVTLKVYDVLGKEVASLVNNSQEVGSHQVTFDASNLASGLYIYTLNAGNFTSSKKMMFLK